MEQKSNARDVFMYLLVIIVLGMSAVNLGTLLFQYVNIYVPDAAIQQCFGTSCQDTVRWSLASIIVVFSVLMWARRSIQRDITQNPEKSESWVRRWATYLTLFISGVTLVGDAVSLLYSWLGGDLTVQFILKTVVVLYIAGSIFYYFLKALHPEVKSFAKAVVWVAVGVVLASVLVGFVVSGSPFAARKQRLDARRVSDLQQIQSQIVYTYWQSKGALPASLDDLKDPISPFIIPVDPETKASYEYIRKAELNFVLCAVFTTEQSATESMQPQSYPVYENTLNESWVHGVGRVCFDRTIDPQLYPVNQKGI